MSLISKMTLFILTPQLVLAMNNTLDLACRSKAQDLAKQTYRSCMTESKEAELQKIKDDYNSKLSKLKNHYENKMRALGAKPKKKVKATGTLTEVMNEAVNGGANSIDHSSAGEEFNTGDTMAPIPYDESNDTI